MNIGYDAPHIRAAEKFGSRPPTGDTEIEHIGVCAMCGAEITDEYEYFGDDDRNLFCTEECFKDFYGFTVYDE